MYLHAKPCTFCWMQLLSECFSFMLAGSCSFLALLLGPSCFVQHAFNASVIFGCLALEKAGLGIWDCWFAGQNYIQHLNIDNTHGIHPISWSWLFRAQLWFTYWLDLFREVFEARGLGVATCPQFRDSKPKNSRFRAVKSTAPIEMIGRKHFKIQTFMNERNNLVICLHSKSFSGFTVIILKHIKLDRCHCCLRFRLKGVFGMWKA